MTKGKGGGKYYQYISLNANSTKHRELKLQIQNKINFYN